MTQNEADALRLCEEEGSLRIDGKKIHGNTLNSLLRKKYITSRLYANGEFFEITNDGISALSHFWINNDINLDNSL